VYGGRYDAWSGRIVGPPDPTAVLVLPCSAMQFELATAEASRIEGNGGRGSGKSEGGVLRAVRHICDSPGVAGQIVIPTYDLTKITWKALLKKVPIWWLRPGLEGIRRAERTLAFVNGVVVRFRSADNPDSLRGWGGEWCMVDEEGDVASYAFDIIYPSLRNSSRPCLWSVGTPKAGDYRDRHDELVQRKDTLCIRFDSYTNPFISLAAIEESKRRMTAEMYRQEILAEWLDLDDAYVCRRWFESGRHGMRLPPPPDWRDITRNIGPGGYRYIAGVDYNLGPPNVAWIYRVFAGAPGYGRRWLLVDIVKAAGEASNLAQALINKGYDGAKCLVVDDASGEYNKYGGKRSANSSARLMRSMGFVCLHPKKNPRIKDRVNALLAKLAPLDGDPTWYYSRHLHDQVHEVMTQVRWKGDELDKEQGVDHDFDGGTYPLHFLDPPARAQIPTVAGL
jgi:hypothetical protein